MPEHFDPKLNAPGALVEAYTNLAVMYMIQNRLDEAKHACEKAIELSPEKSAANMNLGNVLRTLNNRESAIEHVWL